MAPVGGNSLFHPPFGGAGRQRDVFPLPMLDHGGAIRNSGLSRASIRRIQQREAVVKRVNLAVLALNSLWFGKGAAYKPQYVSDLNSLPLAQQESLKNILDKVKLLGSTPDPASRRGAIDALRTAGSSYMEPEPGVGDVVPMVMDQLSLPKGNVSGVSLLDNLDGDAKHMVDNFESHMLQDPGLWTSVELDAATVPPYNDKMLSTRSGYIAFLKHLFGSGILGFTSSVRGRVGAFCVAKKPKTVNGINKPRQRLVLDCRQTNLQFRSPPLTVLGSLPAVGQISLKDHQNLYMAGADIRDCFYAVDCPPGMKDFFCLAHDVTWEEAQVVSGGEIEACFQGARIAPCIKVLPMGFNWSFYLIQSMHETACLSSLGIPRSSLVLEGQPAPVLEDGACISMPYCDNVHAMATDRDTCQTGCDRICGKLTDMGFSLHEEVSACTEMQTLGGVIDGVKGQVRATTTRMWKIILGFEHLLGSRVSPTLVQRLLGHAMTLCVLNRSGMSVFRALYDFVEKKPNPRYLNNTERQEVINFIGLVPLLVSDMRRPWSTTVTASDASPEGYGICQSEVTEEEAYNLGKWNERWRFRRLPPGEWKPRQRALGLDVLSDIRTVIGDPQRHDDSGSFVDNELFPEVDQKFLDPKQWCTGNTVRVLTRKSLAKVPPRKRASRILPKNQVKSSPKEQRALRPAPGAARDPRAAPQAPRLAKTAKRVISRQPSEQTAPKKPRRSVQACTWPSTQDLGTLAQRNKMTKLELKSVSTECRSQYDLYLAKFKGFCVENGLTWPPEKATADAVMADFMDLLYEDGKGAHEGEKTLAALEFNFMFLKGNMPRSRRALRGWRKSRPAVSRLPLPKLAMYGIAMQLLSEGEVRMCLMVLVAFFLYLRPGEAHDLQGKHVIPPVKTGGNQFQWVNMVIRDAEGLKPDKVGVFDNSLPFDLAEIRWIGVAVLDVKKQLKKSTDRLFPFSMEEFREKFQKAAARMNLMGIHPYQLRHGGATEDLTAKKREFNMVKVRGRWKTDGSVRRYAKTGRVQELLAKLNQSCLSFCRSQRAWRLLDFGCSALPRGALQALRNAGKSTMLWLRGKDEARLQVAQGLAALEELVFGASRTEESKGSKVSRPATGGPSVLSENSVLVASGEDSVEEVRHLVYRFQRLANLNCPGTVDFGKMQLLEVLSLSHNQLRDLTPLSALVSLSEVNLNFNQIEDLSPLFDCLQLTKVFAAHNYISSVAGLQKCQQLQELSLFANALGKDGEAVQELLSTLSELPQLRSLDLAENGPALGGTTSSSVREALPQLQLLDGEGPLPPSPPTALVATPPATQEGTRGASPRRPGTAPAPKPPKPPKPPEGELDPRTLIRHW
eukprot:s598_g24.t1